MQTTLLRSAIMATLTMAVWASAVSGQTKAQTSARRVIGTTVSGADVVLETRTVSRENGVVTAALRVALQPPIKTASGDLRSSRTIAMINCDKKTVATKETWYYFDDAGRKEGLHRKPGIPGFGPATKGSLADVAMIHLCSAK